MLREEGIRHAKIYYEKLENKNMKSLGGEAQR